ncbi:MAG: sensor histidine kinase [Leptothrix sp. (in: b-proteobacteria)]
MRALVSHLLQRLPGITPGRRSLRRHLLLWLLLPQLVLWLAAALVTYNVAVRYADLAIDRNLYQSSRALARQVKPVGSGLFVDFPRAAKDIIETDPDDRVYYMVSSPPGAFILGNYQLPAPPDAPPDSHPEPADADKPVFYDGSVTAGPDRVAVRIAAITLNWGEPEAPQKMLVQVAKSRVNRETLARRILIDTAFPLTLLVLLMSALVWVGIRTGLAPLAGLRDAVSGRAPNDLAPIELASAPEEVHALAAALNALLGAVHENVISQRRFISDAAHQLRTPLAGLKSQAELALKENTDQALRARLERVQESATRSAHLVTQLLTLARAEPESASVLGRSRFDLRRMAHEVTAELVPRALKAGIDLGLDEAEDSGEVAVVGNALLLREAVVNLVDNAIRYAGSGAEVTVRVQIDGTQARLDVEDSGVGIDPQLLPQVFERFVRATHSGTGCGLGLAIVKEIVERHAGQVSLQIRVPHGLRARIELPLAAAPLLLDAALRTAGHTPHQA